MKKNLLLNINAMICVLILAAFACMAYSSHISYQRIIKDDIRNISTLISSNIFSDINVTLTKPTFVSLTMANDTFLHAWLASENTSENDAQSQHALQNYLQALREKYNYDSVFLVSEKTKRYYHYNGILKKIAKEDPLDNWYYDFIEQRMSYRLDIDHDQADNRVLTVFINCRMEDDNGNVLGVVGVGVKMEMVQVILQRYEALYGVNLYLINDDGLVQAHTNASKIQNLNIFKWIALPDFKSQVLSNRRTWETRWYNHDGKETFLVSRYVPEQNWFLVVEHDTRVLEEAFWAQIWRDMLISLLVLAVLLAISTKLIGNYRRMMTRLAVTDELTGLLNRRAFDAQLQKKMSTPGTGPIHVFLLDVDNFKRINDVDGHMVGDKVVVEIARAAQESIGDAGVVARWGGDEFAGLLECDADRCTASLNDLLMRMHALSSGASHPITVSMGVTKAMEGDSPDTLMGRVDEALYVSKERGRNCITYL